MAYNIKKTDGTPLFGESGLAENVVDTTKTPLALIGKLTPDYGNYQSENFVHITENFANDTFPENPLKGQFAYNTQDACMYICVDDTLKSWVKMMSIKFEKSINPQSGDMYYDTDEKKLYIYDTTIGKYGEYVLIGPENYNNKRHESKVIKSDKSLSGTYCDIAIDENTSNLITIRIVAQEKMNAQINPEYGVRKPESAAWIYKMLVNSYTNENANQVIEIVGNPNYELIGRTSGEALNWTVNPQIYNNYLRIRVNGVGTTSPVITSEMDSVEWEIDVEIIKV